MMKISVIIPFYNAKSCIIRNIESLVNQVLPDDIQLEIVYVNDGSTDGSELLLEPYQERYSNVFVYTIANQGVSYARNVGLANAQGDFVAFCDVDDYFLPNYFFSISAPLRDGFDLLVLGYQTVDGELRCCKKSVPRQIASVLQLKKEMILNDDVGGFVWNKVYRKSILKNHLFRKDLSICEDLYFNIELLMRYSSLKIKTCDEILYSYVENDMSASRLYQNLFDSNGNFKYETTFCAIMEIVDKSLFRHTKAKLFAISSSILAGNVQKKSLTQMQVKSVRRVARDNIGSFLFCSSISIKKKITFVLYYVFPILKKFRRMI